MMDKSLLLLENAYESFLMSKISENKLCENLVIGLNSLPFDGKTKTFTVQIVNHNSIEKFFGIRVFPIIDDLDTFCEDLTKDDSQLVISLNSMVKRWKNINNWSVELDSTLFNRNTINFTPKELVALTLHEIGHIIYSDTPIEYFYRAYKEAKLRLSLSDQAVQKLMYNIYMIPLTLACMQREWVNEKNQITIEILADKTVLELGYGEELVSAFNKIIRTFGSVNSNDSQQQQELDTSMQWCNNNITDIIKRKETLKDELYYQAIKTKSPYMKAITIIVLNKIGFKMRERYTGYVVEANIELLDDPTVMESYLPIIDTLSFAAFEKRYSVLKYGSNDIATETFNKRKKIKVELPSQYEIDTIAVEVDKISNHHDRIFVLDLIYATLEKITNFEEAISPDPTLVKKWEGPITSMKNDLEMLRKATLDKKTFNKSYKLFVQLPEEAKDYEG